MEETTEVTRARAQTTLLRLVEPAIWEPKQGLEVRALPIHGEPVPVQEVRGREAEFEPFAVGDRWGAAWETTWFRLLGTIPPEWRGAEVCLRIGFGYARMPGFGAEGMVWEGDVPVQGLSPKHDTYRVTAAAAGGDPVDIWIEAAANPVASMGLPPAPLLAPDYGGHPLYRLSHAHLAVFNDVVDGLGHDMRVLLDLYAHIEKDSRRSAEVLRALNACCNLLDPDDVAGTADQARLPLVAALGRRANASAHRMSAVGNAHIDTAWLWPLRETRRKCARTFSSALRLMDDYPDYRFACSQAVQLAWIKEDHPSLW